MDYNYNNNNVYMHPCHGGENQQWYFDGEELKTNYDNKCLDFNWNTENIYMHPCHGGTNQAFYLENTVQDLEHDEVQDEIVAEEEEAKECKPYCNNKKHKDKPWCGKKCAWSSCAGCDECDAC